MLKELFEEKLKKVKPKKMEMSESSEKEHYPNFYLSSDTLPEIKDWEVGEEYKIVMTVEQKSKSMHSEGREEKYNADFDIKKIGCMKNNEGEEENEEDNKQKMKEKYL